MIFKQLPTAISDLNKLGIALKSLDTMNIGAVGVNTANLESYRAALKGLSAEQSVFALASKGATEEQIRQILVTDQAKAKDVEAALAKVGLTTATKALNAEELIELATKKGISSERAKEIASALGLIATEKGQIVSKKQLTVATLKQAGATDAEIASILGLNAAETANIGITNVLTASFAKLWAVITAHPIGAILTAVGAVAVGTIAYINKVNKDAEKALVEAHKNAEKALEDTKTSLSDDKSELQSINSELEQTKDKIREISSIGTPTLTEQNELNKLSTANAQLETQKSLLENNIKLKQESAALDAKELLGTQVEMEYSSILDNSSITSSTESYSYADHAKYQASNLKNAYNIYMKALEEGNVRRQELAQELIDASAGNTAELTSKLLEIVESFKYDDGTIIDGYEDIYNEYMGMIYNLQSLTNPDTFLDIAKSITVGTGVDYEKAISEAYALAYEGNFDVDNLNQDFVKALADAGIDESTIDYIFSLKQKEYQVLIDKVSQKYNPDAVLTPTYLESPDHVDTPEQIKQKQADKLKYEEQKQEVKEINDTLTAYAKENPIEFQLIASYDENFSTLDKYIEEEKSKIQSTKTELESLSKEGNVDLTIRPVIDSSAMQAAGWDVEDGSIATTFTQGEFIWQGDEENGQYVYVHYTPILPDGTVLTPDQLSDYLYGTLESSKNILEADDKGIVLKVDTDLQGVSPEDIKQLQEKGIQTSGMKLFLDNMGKWDDSVHTVQESYYNMSGAVDYVDTAINRLVEDAKKSEGIIADEMSVLNIRDYLNQEDLKDVKDELFNLFKTGELNEDSINSIREFRDMLTATGLSAKDAVNEIEQFFEASNETIDLSDWKTQLNEARNAINSLKTIKGEIGSGYSDSSINTIISDYPQLLAYLDDESSMLEAVNNLLDEQSLKAEIAVNKMLEFNPNIYKEVISQVYSDLEQSNSSLIQTLATGYGIDLNNFSSLAQAKEEIDKQLLQTLMEMWGEYYGIVVDSVTGLASVTQNLPDFYQNEEAQNQLATYNQIITKLNATADKFNNGLDFGSLGDGASKAGKDAGDAYVEAYEKELKALGNLRDRGEISEAEYLARMKALYEKYFKGISKYQDKYFEEQGKYLSGMLDMYNSALSGISKLLGNKISAAQDGKEAAISALEEEKEAAAEAYQAQIDAIDDLIDEKQDAIDQINDEIDAINEIIDGYNEQIDAINDEIDAMREANEERQRAIDLQKAQYELERMQNQRTILQYSEGKGFSYTQDTSGIRDAKQAVDDAQLEIDIAAKEKEIAAIEDLIDAQEKIIKQKEKQIDLIEKEIDALQDEKDNIQEMLDASNEYYDKLIKQQEKMWDSMIKNLENQKSKWEELAEIQEIAEAYAAVKQAADDLGYSVEDLLNGNEAAFEDFKSRYIAIMSDCGQNTAFQDGLEYASGVAKESFGSIVNDSKEVKDALTEIGTASSELEPVAKAIESIGTSSSTASTNTSQIADDMSTLNTNTTGLSDNLTGISDALSGMPEAEKFDAIATAFTNLGEAIKGVATALGVGEEGTVGGLVGALQTISTLSLDGVSAGSANGGQGQGSGKGNAGGGIISQFNALKDAVDAVTSAIGGGGEGGSGGEGTGGEGESGGSGGLINAINEFKSATDEALGGGGESGEGGSGKGSQGGSSEGGSSGAIPQFEQLKTAVDDVTASIGTGEEEGGSGEGDTSTLTGAITALGEKTTEVVGSTDEEETINGRFQQMSDVLGEANEHVTGISDGLSAIDGQEVECTIKVNIETTGGLPVGLAKSTGTALDTMNLESAEYNAKYGKAHAEGTALVSGNWAVQSDEKNALLGELGYEIIVRNGRFFTVGENGAEMFPIKKGDIVFNHEQSKQLLKNGHISGRGKAYADGTVGNSLASGKLRPLQPGDKDYELFKKFQDYQEKFNTQIIPPVNAIQKEVEAISRSISNVNTRNKEQLIHFSTGDIIVQGVQNVDGFAKAVKTHFPNAMIQALNTSR